MKLLILYFSGTGNTEYVTERLKENLEGNGNYVELIKAEDVLLGRVKLEELEEALSSFSKIGLGFPIYGFNAPGMILELVKQHIAPILKNTRKPEFFIYSTCAGPIYLNEIAHFRLKKELEKEGVTVDYERQFFMPANIFAAYPEDVNLLLVRTSARKAEIMAKELSDGWKRLRDDKYLPYFFGWIYLLERAGWKNTARHFKVHDRCNSCGLCERNCPAGNITMKEHMVIVNEGGGPRGEVRKKPCFGKNCYICMRCIYSCPQKAIGLGMFNFAILKNGYSIEDFLGKEVPKDLSGLEKGYLKSLRKYIEQVN